MVLHIAIPARGGEWLLQPWIPGFSLAPEFVRAGRANSLFIREISGNFFVSRHGADLNRRETLAFV